MPDPIFTATTARFALPLLYAAQARKEFFVNEALARVDGLLHPCVVGEAAQPPESAVHGECYIVAADASGGWEGREGAIAWREAGQWLIAEPTPGMRVFDASSAQYRSFLGSWQKAADLEEPSEGLIVDSEARAAIGALIAAIRAAGIIPSA